MATSQRFVYPLAAGAAPSSFEGHTLVLPAVSVGSAPQLALDLLVNSSRLGFNKVARLDHSDCIPFAGPQEGSSGSDIATALELFQSKSHNITLLQQRSPVFKSREAAFTERLVAWIRSAGFREVLLLSSIDAAARTDAELETSVLTLFPNGKAPASSALKTLSSRYPAFEPRPPRLHIEPHAAKRADDGPGAVPHIPGGGMTRRILRSLAAASEQEGGVEAGALLLFCAEGDNRPDAQALASIVCQTLNVDAGPQDGPEGQPFFDEPKSWEGVFGAPLDQSMYG